MFRSGLCTWMVQVSDIWTNLIVSVVCFFQLEEGGTRGHDQKLFKRRFRLDIRKYVFCNRVTDNWNSLSAGCINCNSLPLTLLRSISRLNWNYRELYSFIVSRLRLQAIYMTKACAYSCQYCLWHCWRRWIRWICSGSIIGQMFPNTTSPLCGGSGPPCNIMFDGPLRVCTPKSILIRSAVFAQRNWVELRDRQIDRQTQRTSVTIIILHLMHSMQPKSRNLSAN